MRPFFFLFLAILLLPGCSRERQPAARAARPLAPGEKRFALTGEVLKGDPATGILTVKHEAISGFMGAMSMPFHASRGDIAIYAPGRRIRADLIVDANAEFRLENIWPDDRTEAELVEVGRKLLREDTLIRGKGVYRDDGELLPAFALYDQNGRVADAARFRGRQVMLNFIYTRCPDPNMCPLATANMATAQKLAREAGIPDIEFISISFDPEFDTPGVLKAYADAHKIDTANFSLLTGPESAIKDLLAQFGVDAEFKGEIIRHTLTTLLIGRDGKILGRQEGSQWDPADFVSRMKK